MGALNNTATLYWDYAPKMLRLFIIIHFLVRFLSRENCGGCNPKQGRMKLMPGPRPGASIHFLRRDTLKTSLLPRGAYITFVYL